MELWELLISLGFCDEHHSEERIHFDRKDGAGGGVGKKGRGVA